MTDQSDSDSQAHQSTADDHAIEQANHDLLIAMVRDALTIQPWYDPDIERSPDRREEQSQSSRDRTVGEILETLDRSEFRPSEEEIILREIDEFFSDIGGIRLRDWPAIYEFDGRVIVLLYTNRDVLETDYGGDLLYYDANRKKAANIQFKRMKWDPSSKEWIYTYKGEIEKSLRRMARFPYTISTTSARWRLCTNPNYFNFVTRDFDLNSSRSYKGGMYVPADYLETAIAEGRFRSGPRSGFRITHKNLRYISRFVFRSLIGGCWIGSSHTDLDDLARFALQESARQPVVLALVL